jgi:hypothetical protein
MMFKELIVAVALTLTMFPSFALAGPETAGSVSGKRPDSQWNVGYPEKDAALTLMGDTKAGEDAYQAYCAACHLPSGGGNPDGGIPQLAGQHRTPCLPFRKSSCVSRSFWDKQGCALLQPYDIEVGAGTFHTATFLRAIGPSPGMPPTCNRRAARRTGATARTRTACSTTTSTRWSSSRRRPTSRISISTRCARSASTPPARHPLRRGRLGEPDARRLGPRLGVWLDGMEVTQFTYFQEVGSLPCKPVLGEITYGIERLAMYLQGVENVFDLVWARDRATG